MKSETETQNTFLDEIIQQGKSVYIFLKNGIKLQGKLLGYDESILLLQDLSAVPSVIYKNTVSTVCPLK